MKLAIRVTYFPAIQIDVDHHFRPLMMCWHRYRINGRRLGTARPFPLWRLYSGPQSSSVDQYSETPPEHLVSNLADAVGISAVTRNLLKNNLGREMKRARCDHHNNCRFNRRGSNFLAHSADKCALATQLPPDQRTPSAVTAVGRTKGGEAQEWPVGGVITMDIYEVELCHRGRWEQQDARFVAARNADEAAYKVTGIQLRCEGERRKIRLRVRRLGNGSPPPTLFYAE